MGYGRPSLSQDNGLDATLYFGLVPGGNEKLGRHRRMGVVTQRQRDGKACCWQEQDGDKDTNPEMIKR